MKSPAERAPCCVPGCGRTVRKSDHPAHWDQFICSKHWALIPRAWKKAKARHEREFRRLGFYPRPEQHDRIWRFIMRRLEIFEGAD